MRGFRSPDELLFRWLEQRERMESARGANLVADRGLGFAARCVICNHRERREAIDGPRSAWFCAKCSTPWKVEIVFLLSNQFDRSRRPVKDDGNATLATMTAALAELTLWQKRIYLQLFLYRDLPYALCADRANAEYRSRLHWTERKARRCVYNGRARLSYSLRRGGLLRAA